MRIIATAPQINDQITRNRQRRGVIGQPCNDVQHQIDACGDARARQPLAVFNEQPVLMHACSRRQPFEFTKR